MGRFDTKEKVYKYVLSRRSWDKKEIPEHIKREACVDVLGEGDRLFYHVVLKDRPSGRKIFYLYDSDYCYSMKKKEWNFVLDLLKSIECEFIIPMYPLAPEHSCGETFESLVEVYKKSAAEFDMDQLILAGNGVGAGFALSLNLIAWQEGLKTPDKTLLLSPVLDAEYKDGSLMSKMSEKAKKLNRKIVTEGVVDFISDYWIRDYKGKKEYTSPIHEKMNYISSTIIVVSGTDDVYNSHARKICKKLYNSGIKPFFFEYMDEEKNFYFTRRSDSSVHLRKILKDMLTDSRESIINDYMFEVKRRGELSKKFPEIFHDDIATKYLAKNRIWYKKYKTRPAFRNLIDAAVYHDFDEQVKLFLREYPDATVVYAGCGLDTMFERVDNGRVMWYNLDSPGRIAIRNMYTSENEREKTIDISVHDLSWFNEIKCERDKGLLFVCRNILEYYSEKKVKKFLSQLYERFKGCNILFEVDTRYEMLSASRHFGRWGAEYRRRKLYMSDPNSTIESWDPGYNVISAKPVLDGVKLLPSWDSKLKFIFNVNKRTQGTKVVRVRLGYEKFSAFFDY